MLCIAYFRRDVQLSVVSVCNIDVVAILLYSCTWETWLSDTSPKPCIADVAVSKTTKTTVYAKGQIPLRYPSHRQLRTSFEPDSVIEFGFNLQRCVAVQLQLASATELGQRTAPMRNEQL